MLKRLSAWARTHTGQGRYTPVGIAFHWITALVILLLLFLGWYMGRVDSGGGKITAFHAHMLTGFATLPLAILRFAWRIAIPGPINDADRLGLQTRAAQATHAVFYACFFGLPLSGWVMWSAFAGGESITLAGPIALKPLPFDGLGFATQSALLHGANVVHEALALTLVAVIPLHVGAALLHHFWHRHDVLTAMLPVLEEDPPPEARPRKPRARRSPRRSARAQ
jgi:cytochrome b561